MPKRSKRSKKGRKRRPSAVSGRKPSQSERMDAAVRIAHAHWREHKERLRVIEAVAGVDPVYAAVRLKQSADRRRRLFARYIRLRFGAEVRPTEGDARALITKISRGKLQFVGHGGYQPVADLSVVRPERWARNLREQALFDLVAEYAIADFASRAMMEVGWDVKKAGYDDEDIAWVMCQVFLMIHRERYLFSGVRMQDSGLPPCRERETQAGPLLYVVARRSSSRTAAAFPYAALVVQRLVRELP